MRKSPYTAFKTSDLRTNIVNLDMSALGMENLRTMMTRRMSVRGLMQNLHPQNHLRTNWDVKPLKGSLQELFYRLSKQLLDSMTIVVSLVGHGLRSRTKSRDSEMRRCAPISAFGLRATVPFHPHAGTTLI